MIALINGTNTKSRCSEAICLIYKKYLDLNEIDYALVDLKEMPIKQISEDMYFNRNPCFQAWQEKYLFPADQFIMIVPEYNGSIPGILKLMIDTSDIQKAWWGKKACLTGFSTGRAGNLSGLGHLTHILNYLKVNVHYNKLPISRIKELINEEDELTDPKTIDTIYTQMEQFIKF